MRRHGWAGVLSLFSERGHQDAIHAVEQEARYQQVKRQQAEHQRDMALKALDTLTAALRLLEVAVNSDDPDNITDAQERLADANLAAVQTVAALENAKALTHTAERNRA